MSEIRGRLLQVAILPGEIAFGVTYLRELDGEQQGFYMNSPPHTFGAWSCDGVPVPTTEKLVMWLIGFPGDVTVVADLTEGGKSAMAIHLTRPS